MAECSFRVFAGFMFLEAELKILSACSDVGELRIVSTKFARYGVGGDSAAKGGVAEEDKIADEGFWLKKGLIFGGKNFNIAPAVAPSSCFPLTRRVRS